MSTFLEDPRLRQRWNQISHNAEAVTENAAAGIWTFQHRYIEPCLASLSDAVEPCIAPCLGDRDERARRARAGTYSSSRAEYTFDFYDDWDDDDEALATSGAGRTGGILGGWGSGGGSHSGTSSRGEDWDRLIGGSGIAASSRKAGEVADQPKRKRGMSYGTRGARRKSGSDEEDPTIIPSTAPLGFLGRLPWKVGGTLRYKPSAAFLQDHPGAKAGDENQPLLDALDGDEEEGGEGFIDMHPQVTAHTHTRKRSGTAGSGVSSDSYRSRGDLFPSDGEEYEDAMEIDDEFAVALERVDDRASSNTRSSKGKRPARRGSRAVSATTLSSSTSKSSLKARRSSAEPGQQSLEDSIHSIVTQSIEDLQFEENEIARQEDEEVARKREVATQLARRRGLSASSENYSSGESESRAKREIFDVEEIPEPNSPTTKTAVATAMPPHSGLTTRAENTTASDDRQRLPQSPAPPADDFIPARLPNFR